MLLRTDIHTLFDLDLIKIHPQNGRVHVDKSIKDDIYQELNGSIVRKPKNKIAQINKKYLEERWKR
jgi:putative restriction endonuclease